MQDRSGKEALWIRDKGWSKFLLFSSGVWGQIPDVRYSLVLISSEKQAVRSEERCAVFLAIFINVVKRKKWMIKMHNGGTLGVGGFFEEFHPGRPRPGRQNNCNSPTLFQLWLSVDIFNAQPEVSIHPENYPSKVAHPFFQLLLLFRVVTRDFIGSTRLFRFSVSFISFQCT